MQLPSLSKDLSNPDNFIEPTVKYKIGESVNFKSPSGECIGYVLKEFTKSEFGWLLRVKANGYERDIYFNEIIK